MGPVGAFQARCGKCRRVVLVTNEEADVRMAVYPDDPKRRTTGNVLFMFNCPICKERSIRLTEGSSLMGASAAMLAQRIGVPFVIMPEHESPPDCNFPPFEFDDCITLHEEIDNVIAKLLETDG